MVIRDELLRNPIKTYDLRIAKLLLSFARLRKNLLDSGDSSAQAKTKVNQLHDHLNMVCPQGKFDYLLNYSDPLIAGINSSILPYMTTERKNLMISTLNDTN